EDVTAVAGGLDEASADAIGAAAEAGGRLFLNVGAPDDALRGARCRRHAFHVEASAGMYADALARWLAGEQGLARWIFVDGHAGGGAAYARARTALLAQGGEDAARLAVTDSASAAAALSAIARSSAQVALVLLRGEERVEFLRRYRDADLAPALACLFPPDVSISAIPAQSRLGLWPVLWHPGLFRYGAEQLSDRFQDRFAEPPDSRAWTAWMAAKILAEGALRARSVDGPALVAYLEGRRAQFDGHKGLSLTFRPWDHQLRQPVYLVRARREGAAAREAFEHVAELPLGDVPPATSSRDFLDRLGDGPEQTACRFPGA
ncbi:MAG: ABC transporter substrate-binding protein, partial [Gemmatimonadota bacterium]